MRLLLSLLLIACNPAHAGFFIPDGAVTNSKLASSAVTPVKVSQLSATDMLNGTITASASSNILTFNLKDNGGSDPSSTSPVRGAFRSSTITTGTYVERSVTGALSQTLTASTTLGLLTSTDGYVWIYLIDSNGSGTMKLGASSTFLQENVLQNVVAESFTGTVTIATPGVFTATGHGLNNGDVIRLTTTGALPTGLATGTNYFVVSSAANTFQLALTSGGASIATTGTQSGTHTIHIASSRLVADAVYSNVAVRLVGKLKFNLATPGNWATPSEIGNLVQVNPGWQMFAASIATCSSNPCTTNYQSGQWIQQVTWTSAGTYVAHFQGFSSAPVCIASNLDATNQSCAVTAITFTSVSNITASYTCRNTANGSAANTATLLFCMGPP